MFNALVVDSTDPYRCSLQSLDEYFLNAKGVQLKVLASTLNYKDALAISGAAPVVRNTPLILGIDLAAEVIDGGDSGFVAGQQVLSNGFGLGESLHGGLAQRAVVAAEHLLAIPSTFNPQQAMAIGTAGYTAMLCIMKLQQAGIGVDSGPVLVTGAAGGVGSVAVSLLATLGYEVIASTGRQELGDYLTELGASSIIDRNSLNEKGRALAKERWAGAIDTVGSHTLANACAGTQYGGAVSCCGLAQGIDFPATVAPFILRGVSLHGVDSVMAPMNVRRQAWNLLAQHIDLTKLDKITTYHALSDSVELAQQFLTGKVKGRIVIDVDR